MDDGVDEEGEAALDEMMAGDDSYRNVRQRTFGTVPLSQQQPSPPMNNTAASQDPPSQLSAASQDEAHQSPSSPPTPATLPLPPPPPPPPPPPIPIEPSLDPLQQRAINIALSGANLFLTGGPGVGKSFTLRWIVKQLRAKHHQERVAQLGEDAAEVGSVLVTAPTGVAAILVGGQTVYTKPGPGKPLPTTQMFGNMWGNKDTWRDVRTLIIDEVSMLDAEFFDWHYATLRKIQGFQGRAIQLIVVGDFFQLPPVDGSAAPRSITSAADAGALREDRTPYGSFLEQCCVDANLHYNDPYVPFGFKETKGKLAFQTIAWREAAFVTCKLNRVFRTNSDVLLAGCNAMRQGLSTGPEINALVAATRRRLPEMDGIVPTTLMATKADVRSTNANQLERLDPQTEHIYRAEDKAQPDESLVGIGEREWAKGQLLGDPMFVKEDECPARAELKLRLGSQVMLLQNEIISEEDQKAGRAPAGDQKLVNGSRGVIIGWEAAPQSEDQEESQRPASSQPSPSQPASSQPAAAGPLFPLVRFVNGREKVIGPVAFEKPIYLLGTCVRTQVPLSLAWALTIHKSQGQSLDYMVADVEKCFADGHAYVAVSRAQSLDGLEIRNYQPSRVKVSKLVDFYRALDAGTVDSFLRTVDMWWKPVVEHPQRIPPIQDVSTWKQLYEKHPTFKDFNERYPQGDPLPDLPTWESRHSIGAQRMQGSTCFKCGLRGHWARDCPSRARQARRANQASASSQQWSQHSQPQSQPPSQPSPQQQRWQPPSQPSPPSLEPSQPLQPQQQRQPPSQPPPQPPSQPPLPSPQPQPQPPSQPPPQPLPQPPQWQPAPQQWQPAAAPLPPHQQPQQWQPAAPQWQPAPQPAPAVPARSAGLCKVGCGHGCAPGLTRRGNSFDTCCMPCATGQGSHTPECMQRAAAVAAAAAGAAAAAAAAALVD